MNSISAAGKACRASNAHFFQLLWAHKYSSAASTANIEIPNRIPRGPTDILKALETTISYDFTGTSYKFLDDTMLAPLVDRRKRQFSLAKNAGRKAARWFKDQHPELFTQVISDPPVMSYMPSVPINADTADEIMLSQKIQDLKVADAMKVYELLQEQDKEISEELKLALLELVCFYNGEDPPPMEDAADRYYCLHMDSRWQDVNINTWRGHKMIESLFESLKHLGTAPYSALICGLYSHGAKQEGDEVVKVAKEQNIVLNVHAYNAMILRSVTVYDNADKKFELHLDLLRDMKSKGVKPNITTLNNTLNLVSILSIPNTKRFGIMRSLIADFEAVGVVPSIGSQGFLLRSLVGKRTHYEPLSTFLPMVLKSLKGQNLEMKDFSDVLFFEWCMKASVVLENLDYAIQTLELFLYGRNRIFLDSKKTASFYNNFFHVLGSHGHFETMLQYYKQLSPHTHTANPDFHTMLFEACDMNGAIKEIPGLWKSYVSTGALNEETILKMMQVAVNLSGLPDPVATEVRPALGAQAEMLLAYMIDEGNDRVFEKVPLTAEMLNLFLILLARGAQWRAVQLGLKCMSEQNMRPEDKLLPEIVESCCDHGNSGMTVWTLKFYLASFGYDETLKDVSTKLLKSDFLNQSLKDELKEVIDNNSSSVIDNSSSSSSSDGSSESDSSDSDDDSSDSGNDISVPRKQKPPVQKPDITKITSKH